MRQCPIPYLQRGGDKYCRMTSLSPHPMSCVFHGSSDRNDLCDPDLSIASCGRLYWRRICFSSIRCTERIRGTVRLFMRYRHWQFYCSCVALLFPKLKQMRFSCIPRPDRCLVQRSIVGSRAFFGCWCGTVCHRRLRRHSLWRPAVYSTQNVSFNWVVFWHSTHLTFCVSTHCQ